MIIITERLPQPVSIHDLYQSHPDIRYRKPIQAVDGGVLAVYSDNMYNVAKIDQEGKIISKLCDTKKDVSALIWEDPDLYVIMYGGDIVQMRQGGVIKQHHISNVTYLNGGAVDNVNILTVDSEGSTVISYNVQTGQEEIKLQGLQRPQSITKTVHNNQVLYLIPEFDGHCVSMYDSSWTKQKTIGR